jgi:hypothetical protein
MVLVSGLCCPHPDSADAPISTSVTEEDERRGFMCGIQINLNNSIIA